MTVYTCYSLCILLLCPEKKCFCYFMIVGEIDVVVCCRPVDRLGRADKSARAEWLVALGSVPDPAICYSL